MVGRDRIADLHQDARALDVPDDDGVVESVEERRILHIGGRRIPVVHRSGRRRERCPVIVAIPDAPVLRLELAAVGRGPDGLGDLLGARPDVRQVHRSVGAFADRLGGQVHVHAAGQRVRHAERRRTEVAGSHLRVDPPLEVAVAGQHGDDVQVSLVDRRRRHRRATDRSSRCTWCSRTRPARTRASPGTA